MGLWGMAILVFLLCAGSSVEWMSSGLRVELFHCRSLAMPAELDPALLMEGVRRPRVLYNYVEL